MFQQRCYLWMGGELESSHCDVWIHKCTTVNYSSSNDSIYIFFSTYMKVKVFLTVSSWVDYFLYTLTHLTSSLRSFIYSNELPQTTKHFKKLVPDKYCDQCPIWEFCNLKAKQKYAIFLLLCYISPFSRWKHTSSRHGFSYLSCKL